MENQSNGYKLFTCILRSSIWSYVSPKDREVTTNQAILIQCEYNLSNFLVIQNVTQLINNTRIHKSKS